MAEAQFYLEEANFDYDEAWRMFEEDLQFEKDFDQKYNFDHRKSRRQTRKK